MEPAAISLGSSVKLSTTKQALQPADKTKPSLSVFLGLSEQEQLSQQGLPGDTQDVITERKAQFSNMARTESAQCPFCGSQGSPLRAEGPNRRVLSFGSPMFIQMTERLHCPN